MLSTDPPREPQTRRVGGKRQKTLPEKLILKAFVLCSMPQKGGGKKGIGKKVAKYEKKVTNKGNKTQEKDDHKVTSNKKKVIKKLPKKALPTFCLPPFAYHLLPTPF